MGMCGSSEGWHLYHQMKPEPWRRVEVDPTTIAGGRYEQDLWRFGIVSDLGPGHGELVFRREANEQPGYHYPWSHDRVRGEAHGNYFATMTRWRYLNDTSKYFNDTDYRAGMAVKPSASIGPILPEPKDPLLSLEDALQEAEYMSLILQLEEDMDLLGDAWSAYFAVVKPMGCGNFWCCPEKRHSDFVELVNDLSMAPSIAFACTVCNKPEWEENSKSDVDGNMCCEDCRTNISSCSQCNDWSISDDYLYWVEDEPYCDSCRDNYCSWCDECDEYYRDGSAEYHRHHVSCDCLPQPLQFEVLANSHGTLAQDERLLVELPHGHISQQAFEAAYTMLWREQIERLYNSNPRDETSYWYLVQEVCAMEPEWQTKSGNFTRRLSKLLYQKMGVKLEPGLLSRVGAMVREHSGNINNWFIEVTRDLNQPAAAFANQGSCWWGGESRSLCALKNWGGFALRSYESEDQERHDPSGRAWVQPLNDKLQPTSNTLDPYAYLVYNGYGNLEGYAASRIVAYLTSKTYRKISLGIDYQYINSSSGYFVADQQAVDKLTAAAPDGSMPRIYLNSLTPHDKVEAA